MKKHLFYILLAVAVSACIYPYDADPEGTVPERLVVSGDILIGEDTRIDLRRVLPLSAGEAEVRNSYVSGATVTVESNRSQRLIGKEVENGSYVINTRKAPLNVRYRLLVKLQDGREYSTPWAGVNQAPKITDLSYDVDDNKLKLYCSMNGRDSIWNFCWDYDEVWEYHAYFIPDLLFEKGEYVVSKRFMDYYYCWNSRPSGEPCLATAEGLSENRIEKVNFHNILRTDDRLCYLYSINVYARGLSSAAMAYMEYQRAVSNGTGDLFAPIPSEIRGNVTCTTNPDEQAVGYVSVCKRESQRIFINSANVYKSKEDPYNLLFYPEPDEDGNYNLDYLFLTSSPVSFEGREPDMTNVQWGPKRCTDCRAWGGTKTKPDWWPNEHK